MQTKRNGNIQQRRGAWRLNFHVVLAANIQSSSCNRFSKGTRGPCPKAGSETKPELANVISKMRHQAITRPELHGGGLQRVQ